MSFVRKRLDDPDVIKLIFGNPVFGKAFIFIPAVFGHIRPKALGRNIGKNPG